MMECNKDEALRAKELAEKKMLNNDFEGAQKIAVKAQRLYPELDNISQLLAVCNVHCSAKNNMLGSEKDWYGILQVDRLADEVTIKKQYRRLALVLHPDKNKLPGAEAAFKLIGEANAVLSDRGRRSLYDCKYRVSVANTLTKPPPNQVTQEKSFWTFCQFCKIRHQCLRELVNRALRCQNCGHPFFAYDLGIQGNTPEHKLGQPGGQEVPLRANCSQPSQRKVASNKGASKMPSKEPQPYPSGPVRPEEQMQRKNNSSDKKGFGLHGDNARRSPRCKQNVSYNAKEDENNHRRCPKKARHSSLTGESKEEHGIVDNVDSKLGNTADHPTLGNLKGKQKQNEMPQEQELQRKKFTTGKVNGRAPGSAENGAKKNEDIIDLGSESGSDAVDNSASQTYDYPDTEFYDFDKEKEIGNFAVDQVWACYDPSDTMPRYYVVIKKVLGPGFKLRFCWLEAAPEDQGCIDWTEAGLPVGCGNYRRGSTEDTCDHLIFSHQVQCTKARKGSCIIYPSKGDIWALFKDWDIRWSCEPDKHRSYKYEVVEVLSDFLKDAGIKVGYLNKVNGFVSLFQRTSQNEHSFWIKPNELYRFSHKIPSFRLNGTERKGVPEGSFELDCASLPQNPDDLWYPDKVKEVNRNCVNKAFNLSTNSSGKNGTSKTTEMSKSIKSVDFNCNEMSKVRKSPRRLNGTEKTQNHSNASSLSTKENTSVDQCGRNAKRFKFSSPSKTKSLSSHADFELHSPVKASDPIKSTKSPTISGSEVIKESFYDFKMDKLDGKFQVGQVWCLYGSKGELPKSYAQIKKIVSRPFRLHAVLLEPCSQPKVATNSVCGTFKVKNEKPQIYSPESFSSLVNATFISKNTVEIYPRTGEIWATYKNWKESKPDSENCRYDIVEVLENTKDKIRVSTLARVDGYKSVIRLPRSKRSNTGEFEVEQHEFARFSHQIPAKKLTGEKGGTLRGFWELDPDLIPDNV